MALTPAQKATLKAAILADPTMSAFPLNDDGYFDLASYLNKPASPVFTVWKTSVTLGEIGKAMDGNEAASLVTANSTRLQVRSAFMSEGENPAIAGTRAFYDDVFSTGGITKASLLILWKRTATRVEKILATGTGSDLSPATMGFESPIWPSDIQATRVS